MFVYSVWPQGLFPFQACWQSKVSCDSASPWLCAEAQTRRLTNTYAHSQTFEEFYGCIHLQFVINVYLLLLDLCVQGKWGALCVVVESGLSRLSPAHSSVLRPTVLAATRQRSVHPTHLSLSSFSSLAYLYCPPFFLLYKPTISSLHSFKQQFQYSIAL